MLILEFSIKFITHPNQIEVSAKMGFESKFTVLAYLNNVDGGGETEFPNLDLKIEPKQGRIAYFENYIKKEICADSCHRSLPVKKGEKWAFNLWYHIR